MKLFKNVILIAFALVSIGFVLMLLNCNYPHWYDDDIKVDAAFYQDGSCSFSVNGETHSDENYIQELRLQSDFCTGCTAEGLDGYFLTCITDLEHWDSQRPSLYVDFITLPNTTLKKGVYELTEGDNKNDEIGTHLDILKPPKYRLASIGNGPNGAKLIAVKGQFRLDEIETREAGKKFKTTISGSLSTVAQRRAAGW